MQKNRQPLALSLHRLWAEVVDDVRGRNVNPRRQKLYEMIHAALDAFVEIDVEVGELRIDDPANKARIAEHKLRQRVFDSLRDAFVGMSRANEDPIAYLRMSMTRTNRIAERAALAQAVEDLEKAPTE